MTRIFVAFHTDDPKYTAHADRLRASLRYHSEAFDIRTIPSFKREGTGPGAWLQATNYKSKFVRDMLKKHAYHEHVVYVDADSALVNAPTMLDAWSHPIGVYQRPGKELHAATLVFRPMHQHATKLVDRWVEAQDADPQATDQTILTKLVKLYATMFDIGQLPHGWCVKFDEQCDGERVIEQYQASRTVVDRA